MGGWPEKGIRKLLGVFFSDFGAGGDARVHFSRMRSEGFPFIVGGLGVGAVFAWLASRRRLSSFLVVSRRLSSSLVVVSSSSRLKFAAIGGSFCK